MKKYYYTFQVFGAQVASQVPGVNSLTDITSVEIIAEDYDTAYSQVRPLLAKDDKREIRLLSVIERDKEK